MVNQRGEVVSASSELVEKFDICVDNKISFEDFKIMVSNKAVIYKDPSELDSEYIEDKIYLHMMEKKINLPMLKRKGTFYLFYDETKNQKYINELNFVLTHDLMTKIYNRNYFETIEKEIEEDYNKYSLVMFDLDGLKIFNDYLGHEAGDKLLKNFADALTQVTKKFKDLIPIRMGGDEFLLIGLNKDMNDIEEILYELKIITSNNDLRKHIGFSYGYSQNNFENKSFKLMLLEADANLYKMKPNRKKDKDKLEKFFQSLSS
ncbi:MAG: GGDEF domain-containing protein [Candidatus Izemoplasmatales bacterium]|nr:GGDEF domain-containing protein [Candidatus Izemoplasmatales bacterium]